MYSEIRSLYSPIHPTIRTSDEGYSEDLVAGGKYTFGMQGFRISFSTSFGNNQVKKKEINTGSQSEKSRIN